MGSTLQSQKSELWDPWSIVVPLDNFQNSTHPFLSTANPTPWRLYQTKSVAAWSPKVLCFSTPRGPLRVTASSRSKTWTSTIGPRLGRLPDTGSPRREFLGSSITGSRIGSTKVSGLFEERYYKARQCSWTYTGYFRKTCGTEKVRSFTYLLRE